MSKYIKLFESFKSEPIGDSNSIIIKKGTTLFHGTGEDFDIQNVGVGSYDRVLWTSTSSLISQAYIPVSGSKSYISTSMLSNPSMDKTNQDIQNQLGIAYDISSFELKGDKIVGFKTAPIFKKVTELVSTWLDNFHEVHKLKNESENRLSEYIDKLGTSKLTPEMKYKLKELRDAHIQNLNNFSKLEKEYPTKGDHSRARNEIVNKKLTELGYVATSDSIDGNNSWVVKMGFVNGKWVLRPSNYRLNGRLLIIHPKVDLKIYDMTYNGEISGDLTDLDYHKIDTFRKIEKMGYDGVKINDFAQVESEGNFGHTSIGLFSSSIPQLNIEAIDASHPEDFSNRDYESNEYKEYKKSKNGNY